LFLTRQELIYKREKGEKAQQAQGDERKKEEDIGEKKERTNKEKENGGKKLKGEDE
jgi:hypothetical protein